MDTLKQYALEYAAAGFRVLPLKPRNKIPLLKDWTNAASSDPATVAAWWDATPDANIGCLTGFDAGFFVLDVDCHKEIDGQAALMALESQYGTLPGTVEQLTGGGGRQLFFKYPQGAAIKNKTGIGSIVAGVEVKGDGGQVVLPPSIHPSGRAYEWEASSHPSEIEMADAPEWLLNLIYNPSSVTYPHTDRNRFQRLPGDGTASMILDRCIFMQAIRDNAASVSEPQWVAALSNLARCADGEEACHAISQPYPRYAYDETAKKIQHVLNDMHPASCSYIQNVLGFNQCPDCGVKAPVAFALKRAPAINPVPDDFFDTPDEPGLSKFTDLGNAEYFAQYYAGRVKHCAEMDKWLVWDGKRWAVDSSSQIMVLAGKCIRSMYDFLSGMEPPQRTQLFKHATKSEDANKLSSMVKLARGYMSVSVDALDQDPWLLNAPTGIIDLHDGLLGKHDPSKNMTKIINAEYDPAAACPTFERFIESTFDGNLNVIGFVQRFLGYCLTGITREQQFVIAWGSGRNGKGTLLNLITDILADYAKTTPTEVLYAKKFDKPSNDIARLNGARFVLASEGERGKRLDEPLVKKMTGQDVLAARFLYKETFEFMPQFKIILMTNDKPSASEDDAALWARIQLVPFTRKFEGAAQDKNLKEKLSREMSGILNWLIKGCLAWQREGLAPPEEVVQATQEYRGENDRLRDWINECCETGPDKNSNSKALYKSFIAWSMSGGEKNIMKLKYFNAALEKKGFYKYPGGGNVTKTRGIALSPINESDSANYYEQEQPY